jgi:hypothetical protein
VRCSRRAAFTAGISNGSIRCLIDDERKVVIKLGSFRRSQKSSQIWVSCLGC